ncbi:hypothetical protein GN958_ATG08667 [Phytophthora infestans]|uniref:Uncharacterized protein n=1 Tax=Phytophthora infestans TaxID=4787 RepID=A0A8S9UN10_PHYIN|nr:hypothetical protein GN958_ATG08667 [Phytophthora infestans]
MVPGAREDWSVERKYGVEEVTGRVQQEQLFLRKEIKPARYDATVFQNTPGTLRVSRDCEEALSGDSYEELAEVTTVRRTVLVEQEPEKPAMKNDGEVREPATKGTNTRAIDSAVGGEHGSSVCIF